MPARSTAASAMARSLTRPTPRESQGNGGWRGRCERRSFGIPFYRLRDSHARRSSYGFVAVFARLWGRMVSCAPIANRRKLGRLTIGPLDTILPHNLRRRGGARQRRLFRSPAARHCLSAGTAICAMALVVWDRQVRVNVTAVVEREADDLARGIDGTCAGQIQGRTGGDEGVEVDQFLALPQKRARVETGV